jgi:bifunctional non-homologous end joining protein LigD
VHLETPKKLKKTAKAAVKPDTIEGIKITHADRLVYPDYKITKMDVIKYYQSVEKWILPHLRHRPLSLLRCVGGQESCFFQKHLETMKVDGVEEFNFTYKKKKENVIFVDNIKGVLGLAQWGTLEFHVWGSTAPQVLKPNLVVFDLDPDQGLPWKKVKDAAYQIRENLKALGLESYLKVTGGKGLHIHVPCRASYTWDEIKNFAHTFVREMEDRRPDLYTTNTIKKQREGKIFLDYLRNGFGATSVAPYGLRAHEAPSVALPLRWEELRSLKKPNSFLINNVVALLKKRKKDPWVGYFDNHQKIKILESH